MRKDLGDAVTKQENGWQSHNRSNHLSQKQKRGLAGEDQTGQGAEE